MGPNGSGKSTLLKLIKGIETPESGTVEVSGRNSTHRDYLGFSRKKIGYITENPYMQIVAPVVREDLLFGLENLKVEKVQALERIKEVSRMLRIEHLIDKSTDSLSSGELQRVAIAGILVLEPEILLSDESTSWLDTETALHVIEIYKELTKRGITVLHVTHNPLEAVYADRVVVLKEGALLSYGSPKAVFSSADLLLSEGVGVPLSSLISERLYDMGLTKNHPALFPEELV
jgi:energy-coupling factor transport system ATP-binding protein